MMSCKVRKTNRKYGPDAKLGSVPERRLSVRNVELPAAS